MLIYLTEDGQLAKEQFKLSDLSKSTVQAREREETNLDYSPFKEEFVSLAVCPKSRYIAVNSRSKGKHHNSRIVLLSNTERKMQILNEYIFEDKKIRFFQAFNFGDYVGGEDSVFLFGFTSSLRSKLYCFLVEGEMIELQKVIDVGSRYPCRVMRLRKEEEDASKMIVSDQKGKIFYLKFE